MSEGDPEITDGDELYRLIHPQYVEGGIINRGAYYRGSKPDPEISVNIARLTSVARTLALKPGKGHYLGVLLAAVPRGLGLSIDPDPTEGNDAHALIKGASTRAECDELAFRTCMPGDRASLDASQ